MSTAFQLDAFRASNANFLTMSTEKKKVQGNFNIVRPILCDRFFRPLYVKKLHFPAIA